MNENVRQEIADEMAAAPRGARVETADRLAAAFGLSRGAVYRAARVGGAPKRGRGHRPDYVEWTRTATAIALAAPGGLPMDLALRAGVESGELPPEALGMPVSTAHRIRRSQGWTERPRRHARLDAERPLQAVQLDGSTSESLVVDGRLDGGDWRLRLHRRPWRAGGYKNKPLGADRLRVLVYSVWDMCTGVTRSRYVVARGENAVDATEFLLWAFARGRSVFSGLPVDLWSDLGPFARSGAARDLLERLDVALCLGGPYAKERMGGVERGHRTRWARFERALFVRGKETISLSGLNARLEEFEMRESNLRASRTQTPGRPRMSRAEAWRALAADARECPPNALETLATEARRRVDGAGIVRWGGREYEVADWHSKAVLARRALAGGDERLTLEDEATGERRTAEPRRRRPYGQVRAQPASPLDALPKTAAEADLYAPANVVPLPSRLAPPAPLADPMDADALPSLDDAMRLFAELCPVPLSEANRTAVAARLEGSGLSRRATVDLANELRGGWDVEYAT